MGEFFVGSDELTSRLENYDTDWFVAAETLIHKPTILAIVDKASLVTKSGTKKFKIGSVLTYKNNDNKPKFVYEDSDVLNK